MEVGVVVQCGVRCSEGRVGLVVVRQCGVRCIDLCFDGAMVWWCNGVCSEI